uniref:Ion transport domain-containing protein n=1 Tax=Balaenoptera musculus TaxID=9771 RepID=A0A8C0E230_BALMU
AAGSPRRVRPYFSDIVNSLDAAIIVVTLLVNIAYIFYDFKVLKDFPKLTMILRPLRLIILIRVFHLAHQKRHLEMLTRRMVSGQNMFHDSEKMFVFQEILARVVDIYILFFFFFFCSFFMLIYVLQMNDCFKPSGFRKQTAIQEGRI